MNVQHVSLPIAPFQRRDIRLVNHRIAMFRLGKMAIIPATARLICMRVAELIGRMLCFTLRILHT